MSLRHWEIVVLVLAVGASVQAQQLDITRSYKVGGHAPEQGAERLLMKSQGGGRFTSEADTSQAVAPLNAPGTNLSNASEGRATNDSTAPTVSMRQRDNAIEVAEKRVEFARQQLADLNKYNKWSPPQDQIPQAVRMFPQSKSYSPVRLAEPVQGFMPRSTFSHALVTAERAVTEAELQLESLVTERNANHPTSDSRDASALTDSPVNRDVEIARIEAAQQRERFLAESAQRRLEQLSQLSRLTYSTTYAGLYRKLELERLEHELAAESLEDERRQLENGGDSR